MLPVPTWFIVLCTILLLVVLLMLLGAPVAIW
jgi:hypothetical protein